MSGVARSVRSCTCLVRSVSHYTTQHSRPPTPRLVSHYTTLTHRPPTPLLYNQQQCMYLAKEKKAKKDKKAPKKGNQKGPSLLKILPEVLDIVELNGRMENALSEMRQTYALINVKSNPAILTQVYVKVGVEHLPVTDICEISSAPGKPIILDCSIYPEHKQTIITAINSETAFKALPDGTDAIKLASPKLTTELRQKLATQVRSQRAALVERLRAMRNSSEASVKSAKTDENTKRRASDQIHELFLHHKGEADSLCKVKEKDLQKEFEL